MACRSVLPFIDCIGILMKPASSTILQKADMLDSYNNGTGGVLCACMYLCINLLKILYVLYVCICMYVRTYVATYLCTYIRLCVCNVGHGAFCLCVCVYV